MKLSTMKEKMAMKNLFLRMVVKPYFCINAIDGTVVDLKERY